MRLLLPVALLSLFLGCGPSTAGEEAAPARTIEAADTPSADVLNTAFLALEGVYNSELMAPYDVLQHSIFRDSTRYLRTFVVSPDGGPFTTFEGLTIDAHYSFADAPPIDVLVIPSTVNSMGADLENEALMAWLEQTVAAADYVITVCDGAFPLAATGALDGRIATTFPADRDRLAEMFPAVDVRYDVNMVVDGKYITSVGGGRSYEPALYLIEKLYGAASAQRTAEGLVLDWDLEALPHVIADEE